jgi:conjugal transfer ATP-binding protein TraC
VPVPLSDQQLFSLLWRYFNPQARLGDSPHYAPPETFLPQRYILKGLHRAPASLRNRLVGSEIAHHHWDHLRIGHYFLGAVSMGSLPVGYTEVGMPTRLLGLPGMTWLLLDYQHERYGPATRALEARARRFHSAEDDTGGLTTYIDASVRAGASESEEAALHLVQTGSHPFRLGMTALFAAQTRAHLTEHLEEASAAFAQLSGITPYQEGVALLEQFGALAPFSGRVNERLHLVMEENATDFIPINGPWRGSERPVVLLGNRWNSVTALDPFDPHAANWNGIIIGGSGTGKTFLMQRIVNEVLRTGADLVIVDRGFGYAPLVQLYGGEVISFDVTGCVGLNPFDLPPGVTEPDDDKTNFLLALIRAMIPGNAADTSLEDAILMAAIAQTYARHRTEYTVNGVVDVAVTGATLSDLVRVLVTLEEIGDRPVRELERDIARQLALKLTRWTGDTPFGRLLDRTTTIPAEAPIMYYETSRLERYPELQNVATLIISEEVWRRVKRQPSRRKLVVLDEFSALLDIPQAADFIVELYRRFRRYNAAVYAVTQTLKDFTAPQATGILQNTTFHYLFPLPGEDALIQELLNLPDEAIAEFQRLVTSERYREVLVWLRRDGRLEGDVLRISPRPLEYWAFSTHGDDVALREDTTSQLDGQLLAAIQMLAARHPYGVRSIDVRRDP